MKNEIFLHNWITTFPDQSQALYAFMLTYDSKGVADFQVLESFNKSLAENHKLLIEGLYPQTGEMNMYMEQYKNLFASNSNIDIAIALPDSYSS